MQRPSEHWKRANADHIVATYVKRDVRGELGIHNLAKLRRLVRSAAHQCGKMLNYAAYLAYIWQILRFVRRLLAYIWQVFVRKAQKIYPLSGFSRKTCAIYKRETSGQDAKSAIYKPDITVQLR